MDQLLFYLPLSGSAFKKIYYDPSLGRATSRFIKAEDLVVPYYAVDLLTAPRITHVMYMTENELRKLQRSGFYRDTDMSDPSEAYRTELDDKFDEIEGLSRTAQNEEFTNGVISGVNKSDQTAAYNAIQFKFDSGNIADGTITLYGRKN